MGTVEGERNPNDSVDFGCRIRLELMLVHLLWRRVPLSTAGCVLLRSGVGRGTCLRKGLFRLFDGRNYGCIQF